MHWRSLKILSLLGIVLYCTPLQASSRHVLLIGLDGCRADAFFRVAQSSQHLYPHFQHMMQTSLLDEHLYAGGHLEDDTRQMTLSEPGWTTLLTGVWARRHHIYSNDDLEQNHYNHAYPTVFNYIKNYLPGAKTAAFTDWGPTALLAGYVFFGNDAADSNRIYPLQNLANIAVQDAKMTVAATEAMLSESPPTLLFIRYGNPDEAGHVYGFEWEAKPYLEAIQYEIGQVDALLQAVQQSEQQGHQWLIIITTDHGGHGHIHGTQHPADRAIFAVVHATDDERYNHLRQVNATQGQTVILPTIFDYLHLPKVAYQFLEDDIIDAGNG